MRSRGPCQVDVGLLWQLLSYERRWKMTVYAAGCTQAAGGAIKQNSGAAGRWPAR